MAGRDMFELSRALYTPYPLSRRVLSATQPPPRESAPWFDSIRREPLPYLLPDGGSRWSRRAPDVGSWPQDGVRGGAWSEEQALVHARPWQAQRSLLPNHRSCRASRATLLRLRSRRAAGR